MAPKQRMRIANEKASKNVTMRGNVPKSSVSITAVWSSGRSCQLMFFNDISFEWISCRPEYWCKRACLR